MARPAPSPRPTFAHWLFVRDLGPRDVSERLGASHETIRRWCLPFGDPRRRIPDEEAIERIFEFTGGEIGPLDFYPEHLRRTPAASSAEAQG